MSEAPERIWAHRWSGRIDSGQWFDYPRGADTEYIRADLFDNAVSMARAEGPDVGRALAMANIGRIWPVIRALEAWQQILRDGRTVEPSIIGLGDMIGILTAVAEAKP